MKKSNSFRSLVMNYAHAILKGSTAYGFTWSECLRKAWEIFRLKEAMKIGEQMFYYLKTNGTVRTAHGILNPQSPSSRAKSKKSPYSTVCYFDTAKQQFRSFRVENFLGVVKIA